MLGGLQSRDAIDVNQGAMHGTVGFGVNDDDAVFAKRHVFRMTHLMDFAIRQAQLERLKRGAVQPFTNRFHVHTGKSTTRETQ